LKQWKDFLLYIEKKSSSEDFDIAKHATNLKRINIDFGVNILYSDYLVCKMLCESPQIKKISIMSRNFQMFKKVKSQQVSINLPNYKVSDYELATGIMTNLPINTNEIKLIFDHINLRKYCWNHNNFNCKNMGLCDTTNNTIFLHPDTFTNLPLSVNKIIINACCIDKNFAIIFDKCKLSLGIDVILNLKTCHSEIKLKRIIFPEQISNFTILSKQIVDIPEDIMTYLKNITTLSINN
jgi:hypothetical protein